MPADSTYEPGKPGSRNRAAKPKPKPKPRPKPQPTLAASVRQLGRQGERVARRIAPAAAPTPRSVFGARGSGGRKPSAARGPVDPARAAFESEADSYAAHKKAGTVKAPDVQTGGLDRLQLLGGGSTGRSIGGLLKNFGTGATRAITDAPGAVGLAAESLLWGAAAGAGLASGDRPGSTHSGGGTARGLIRGVESSTRKDLQAAGTGVKKDYIHRIGPFNPFGGEGVKVGAQRFYDDPFPTIMDLGAAYSAVGRAPAAAARAASAGARVVGAERAADRLARAGSRSRVGPSELYPGSPAGKLHRPPRKTYGAASGVTEKGRVHTATRVTEVPQRPYSINAVTRAGQRGADRLRARVGPKIEAAAERHQVVPGEQPTTASRLTKPFTAQAKHDRAQSRGARDVIFRREQIAAGVANRDIAPFAQAARKLKPDKTVAGVKQKGLSTEQIALSAHLEDYLAPRAGFKATQLRDIAVARMEKGLAKAKERGDSTPLTERQIEQVRNLPDELVELTDMSNPAVRRVAEALEEGRKLDELSQARAVKAGTISEATAKEMKGRTAALLLAGQEWAPAILKEMKAAGIPKPYRDMLRTTSVRETPKLRTMREKLGGLDADVRNAERMGEPTIEGMRRAKRDEYFKKVRNEENRNLGFTHIPHPEMVGGRGVYIPKTAIDRMGGGGTFARRRGFSGPTKAKQSKGYNTQKGGFDMNPNLLADTAKRAIDNDIGPMSAKALDELVGLAAYLDEGGMMVSGQRAAQMARYDSDRVVLVHKGRLREALAKLDDLEEGKFLDPADVKMFYGKGESWLQAIPEGKITGEYVAISKAAADVWREAPTTNPLLKGADAFLDYWKGGILALSPRWYVNSTLGISFQYLLMAGGDFRSIIQANRRGPIRDAIPDPVVLNNLAHDVGLQAGISPSRARAILDLGFRTNNRMESGWRRGAYVNRAKRALRDEGVKLHGLSEEELARLIDQMPPSIARNVVRDVDLFMGEFRKFNRFERDVIKRVIPFYSWLRVIARLTISLPYRSPIRAEAVAVLGRAGEYGINPDDYKRPLYERGGFKIGKYRVPTQGFSPPGALVGGAEAATNIADDPGSALGLLGEEALSWAHPALGTAAASTFGTTPFGRPVIAPPGYAGTTSGFGGPERVGVGGRLEQARIRIPFDEALLSTLAPAQVQFLRSLSSGGRHPYDTTRTLALLNARFGGGSSRGLFLNDAKDPYRFPLGGGVGSSFGINPYRESAAALDRRYRKEQKDIKADKRATARRKRKEGR